MEREQLTDICEPVDYFQGRGHLFPLPTPKEILLFVRWDRTSLQQKALQNRSHHRWVLIFNLRSAGQVHVDHRAFAFRPGEALLVQPFQFHHFTHLETEQLVWLFCTFELDATPLLDALRHRVLALTDEALLARERLLALWRQTSLIHETEQALGPLLQSALLTLLLELRRSVAPEAELQPPLIKGASRLLERLNRLLAARCDRPLTIDQLADKLSMSPAGLRLKFREVAGVSLGAYLKNHRIHRAMALLRTGDLSIGSIAAEVGYTSTPAFSRAFRAATGETPLAYRRA